MKWILFVLLTIFLAGCAPSIREQMAASGYDPKYIDGYEHGWGSGYVAAGHPYHKFIKDTHRFESDSQYQQGWTDGFNTAKGRYESIQRSMSY